LPILAKVSLAAVDPATSRAGSFFGFVLTTGCEKLLPFGGILFCKRMTYSSTRPLHIASPPGAASYGGTIAFCNCPRPEKPAPRVVYEGKTALYCILQWQPLCFLIGFAGAAFR
jgi:hypothetical protein